MSEQEYPYWDIVVEENSLGKRRYWARRHVTPTFAQLDGPFPARWLASWSRRWDIRGVRASEWKEVKGA